MILRLQNVGPLRDAEVDLSKRLLLLTGPNNTGKTYLAWSVYGLHKTQLKSNSALLERCVEKLLSSPRHEIEPFDYQDLQSSIATAFSGNIHHCFAAERGRFQGVAITLQARPDELVLASGRVSLRMFGDEDVVSILVRAAHSKQLALGVVNPKKTLTRSLDSLLQISQEEIEALARETTGKLDEMTAESRAELRTGLMEDVALFLSTVVPNCVIFPAERIAVNIFAKELALKRSELVDELVDADIDGQRQVSMDVIRRSTGRYPWPIRDSLRVANDLTRLAKLESPFADLASELEVAVLGGHIDVSGEGEMSFAPREAPDTHLGVHLTASVVKSLSSLVFYFRHLARTGDFLIIDEPELNLHPDNQRKLARILAKAIKRGFKIMMSTHSDYVVRELNHLIMLDKFPPEEARALGYDPDCALAPGDVGVYLFEGGSATTVPVSETGFSIQTIDDQINALNADAQTLYAHVFGEETER